MTADLAANLVTAMSAFDAPDLVNWNGLPAGVRLVDFAPFLAFDAADVNPGEAGTPRHMKVWVPAQSSTYAGGVRLWLDDDGEHVLILDGLNPVDADGNPFPAPPGLGPPDGRLDAVLGPFHVRKAERVHASLGLALQVYPETGILVGVLGFAPTTLNDYRARLQPHREPTRPLNTQPANTRPSNTEPLNTEPRNTEPLNTEPRNTEPLNTEPRNTEPMNTEPVRR